MVGSRNGFHSILSQLVHPPGDISGTRGIRGIIGITDGRIEEISTTKTGGGEGMDQGGTDTIEGRRNTIDP